MSRPTQRKIYAASSWRNPHHESAVDCLRRRGHAVYDFKNPAGRTGFSWREIDPDWKDWTAEKYLEALEHPAAREGFGSDWGAMLWADTGVLLGPCGKSAHLEAGYFVGAGKPLYIVLPPDGQEPELMYKMATRVFKNVHQLLDGLEIAG